ncbi:unnamed protein product [Orchesella dallaii]|uniref:Latrophilin-3 n=1 Tax=Orchesella dallaii TaxID=48710 RepID=A0ABP1QB75_9HEXA
MRRILNFAYLLVISYIVGYFVFTTDFNRHGVSAEVKTKISESSKHINKRSSFEGRSFDLQIKPNSGQSQVRFFYTSPKSGYHEWGGVNNNDRSTGQVQDEKQKRVNYFYKTDSFPEEKAVTSSSASYSLTHIGCFSTWGVHNTSFHTNQNTQYNASYTPITCAEMCLREGKQYQVVILKGAECQCALTYAFSSLRVPDEDCYIPCPLKDFNGIRSRSQAWNACGGNRAYSIYCRSGENSCNEIQNEVQEGPADMKASTDVSNEKSVSLYDHHLKLDQECAICDVSGHADCKRPYINPGYDYFPANSPEECVDYCSQNISYRVVTTVSGEHFREPTQYAVLMWLNNRNEDLPLCSCIDEDLRGWFVPATDVSECNQMCPGNPHAKCGGLHRDYKMPATIYCVGTLVDGQCQDVGATPTSQLPTTTDPCSTGEIDCDPDPPSSSTSDPCSDEDVDCDPDPPATTDQPCSDEDTDPTANTSTSMEPHSTTYSTEYTSSTTKGTTPITPTVSTTSEIPTTTTNTTTTNTTTTTTNTTTTTTTTPIPPISSSTTVTPITTPTSTSTTTPRGEITSSTKVPGSPFCKKTCRSTDRYGIEWEVCAGSVGINPCFKVSLNSTGVVFWTCLKNGSFETPQPDSSNCSSPWLGEKEAEFEKIDDIDEARDYIERLAEACRNAQRPNSNTTYFGHELRNITSLVGLTVERAKSFSPKLSQYEPVVETAVDLSAFLMQFKDPWKDLSDIEKSSISTHLIDNTEDSLFHLTELVKTDTYSKIFVQNPADVSKFLILAETFYKRKTRANEIYEFPPLSVRDVQDSFIKLPSGWEDLLPSSKVDIAAMSIDSEYISYMMPGQYRNLGAGSKIEVGNHKVINGRLISFSLLSASSLTRNNIDMRSMQNSSVYFKEKGVEITFRHDTEAWGDAVHDIPRKLHDGEKPKAVLGSTQCVFWNTKTQTWSSNGCQIIASSRYETICECNHLTSFAVLMDIHRYVGKEFALEVITLVLCSLSTVALLLSVIILSSVNGLQKIRASITKNLSACLMLGNTMVMFVLDRNYFRMSEGLCMGAAIITHYIFLCAFMWMVIEGVQLYRMVVHVFDSGRSYIKHFGVFAYGTPLIVVAITATTGYLKGDQPYGGDVYCWLDGLYIWSFLAPVAIVITINLIILFIALKTAYQLQQNKKLSPTFIMGRVRSYKTWFKGSFSLTVILGLTWVVGFFTLMNAPAGIIAAYVFTLLNASQGIFIFIFHCVFNDKVRAVTRRNLSTYLPSWLSSSVSSNPAGNDTSIYSKRPLSSMKSGESALSDKPKTKLRRSSGFPEQRQPYIISKRKSQSDFTLNENGKDTQPNFADARNHYVSATPVQRCESVGTISSMDSVPFSDNGNISSDTSHSHSALISNEKSKNY